jgi:hypothetical protein
MGDENKKKIEFDPSKTWLGVGVKGGGMLFVVGLEEMEGNIWHMASPVRNWFSVMSVRLGLGLGGSIGLVAICIFNCENAKTRLDKTSLNDWGINVAITGKWSAVAKALKNAGFWGRIAKLGLKRGTRLAVADTLENVELLRNDLHLIYNGLDIATSNGEPKVIVIDSPAGVGLELSVNYSLGTIEIM